MSSHAPPIIESFTGRYEFLSNFHRVPIGMPCTGPLSPTRTTEHGQIVYPTIEHAFQAHKTFDINERERIANIPKPGKAKRAGRRLQLRGDWEDVKVDIMTDLLRIKFARADMAEKLLATGTAVLVHGNTWGDRYWGMYLGQGRNQLGTCLMRVRQELQIATA